MKDTSKSQEPTMHVTKKSIDSFISPQRRIEVQELIDNSLESIIEETADHSLKPILKSALFPGRRLRPVLFMSLLDSFPRHENSGLIHDIATAIELCHRGSIIMDDMIDEDRLRRGFPTFHTRFGSKITCLSVIILIGKSINLLRNADDTFKQDLTSKFAAAFGQMCIGELSDIGIISKESNSFGGFYHERVLPKTASLFEFIFWAAASLNNYPDQIAQHFSRLGLEIGNVYQIYNDIYDEMDRSYLKRGYTQSVFVTFSLPLAIALERAENQERKIILSSIGKQVHLKQQRVIQRIVRKHNVIQLAQDYATQYFEKLVKSLRQMDYFPSKNELINFCFWVRQKECWDQSEFRAAGYRED